MAYYEHLITFKNYYVYTFLLKSELSVYKLDHFAKGQAKNKYFKLKLVIDSYFFF